MNNYRSISTLYAISNIFEKLMCSRLNFYIENNNILSSAQFGFRKGISTEDAILDFLDDTYNSINKSEYLAAECLDLSKAVDTVNHYLHLGKLHHLWFREIVHDWFKLYLSIGVNYVSGSGDNSVTLANYCWGPARFESWPTFIPALYQ